MPPFYAHYQPYQPPSPPQPPVQPQPEAAQPVPPAPAEPAQHKATEPEAPAEPEIQSPAVEAQPAAAPVQGEHSLIIKKTTKQKRKLKCKAPKTLNVIPFLICFKSRLRIKTSFRSWIYISIATHEVTLLLLKSVPVIFYSFIHSTLVCVTRQKHKKVKQSEICTKTILWNINEQKIFYVDCICSQSSFWRINPKMNLNTFLIPLVVLL